MSQIYLPLMFQIKLCWNSHTNSLTHYLWLIHQNNTWAESLTDYMVHEAPSISSLGLCRNCSDFCSRFSVHPKWQRANTATVDPITQPRIVSQITACLLSRISGQCCWSLGHILSVKIWSSAGQENFLQHWASSADACSIRCLHSTRSNWTLLKRLVQRRS